MTFRDISGKTLVLMALSWLALASFGSTCSTSTDSPGKGGAAGVKQTGTGGVAGTALTSNGGATSVTAGQTTAAGGAGQTTAAGGAGRTTAVGGAGQTTAAGGAGQTSGEGGTKPSSGGAGGTVPHTNGDAGDAPLAGSGGSAGDAGESSSNPRTVHHAEDLGEGDGQDVICIGDSWMNIATNGGGIQSAMDRVSGQKYRGYGVVATTVLSGQIPGQYTRAKKANPNIKTVIMTGGGNDIIMDGTMRTACAVKSGDLTNNACKQKLYDVVAALGKLWAEMSTDGVKDICVINYAKGSATSVSEYISKDVQAEYQRVIAALPAPVVIHFIQTEEIVNGPGGAGISSDGIHPTRQACTDIAQATYDHLIEAGARR